MSQPQHNNLNQSHGQQPQQQQQQNTLQLTMPVQTQQPVMPQQPPTPGGQPAHMPPFTIINNQPPQQFTAQHPNHLGTHPNTMILSVVSPSEREEVLPLVSWEMNVGWLKLPSVTNWNHLCKQLNSVLHAKLLIFFHICGDSSILGHRDFCQHNDICLFWPYVSHLFDLASILVWWKAALLENHLTSLINSLLLHVWLL